MPGFSGLHRRSGIGGDDGETPDGGSDQWEDGGFDEDREGESNFHGNGYVLAYRTRRFESS